MNDTGDHRAVTVMSPARREGARAQLVDVVNGQLSTRSKPPKAVLIAAVVLVGAAASAGAVSLLTHAPVTDPYTVECRATLDPDEQGNQVATVVPATIIDGVTQTQARPELANAVNICAQLMTTGWPAPGSPHTFNDEPPPTGPLPQLTLCVAADGHAVVVPSTTAGICSQLGLSGGPE